jgi:hypothetical protein
MKKIFALLTIISLVSFQTFGQEKDQNIEKLEALESDTIVSDTDVTVNDVTMDNDEADTATVKIGNKLLKIQDSGDETTIQFGNKELKIKDEGDDTDIDFGKVAEDDEDEWEDVGGARNFKGHLGGFEFGFNSYGNDFFSTTVPSDWNLNSTKSSSFNIIFPGLNIGFSKHFGIVTSVGLNYNNYRFDGNLTILKDASGNIVISPAPIGREYEKSKLAIVYAMVPVVLEAQIPVSHGKTLNIGAGVVGSVKIGSHTKVVYFEDGRQKDKNRDDFNLSLLRYGATARVGYEMVQLYGTCYFSPLFEKGKGPELYPFEVGIALTFND